MTPLAPLLLAACALAASAATLPAAPTDLADVSLDDAPPEKLPEPAAVAQEPAIPVEVIVEDPQPSLKLNEVSDDIARPAVDLRNPGPPQRQEHETQNPDIPDNFVEDAMKLFSVKENIEEAQDILKQGFQGVTEDIQKWVDNNEQVSKIHSNIKDLKLRFTSQIQKLNDSLQGIVKPSEGETARNDFRKVETRLKVLEDYFNNGVNTLSESVNIFARLKSQNENLRQAAEPAVVEEASPAPPAVPAPSTPAAPQNPLLTVVGAFSDSVNGAFTNFTQTISNFVIDRVPQLQNLINRSTPAPTPAGAAADTPDGTTTTARPAFPWQNWSINNWFTGTNQNNLPNFSTMVNNFFQSFSGTTTAKPAEASTASATSSAPSEASPEKQPEKPADTPATLPPAPVGPIRQILNSIPVVQRIQSSLQANTETPRDPAVKSDIDPKGGFYKPPRPVPGDNNDSGLKEKSEIKAEEIPKEETEIKKETEEITETKPEIISEKTE